MNDFAFKLTQDDLNLISEALANAPIPFKDAGKVQGLFNKLNAQMKEQLPKEAPKE